MTSILKVDTIQDADGNNIINESGNTITIGASGDTTNIIGTLQNDGAAVGGTNTPAFEAYLSANQTISHDTVTKIQFNTEVYDTDNCYDNSTNYRFTPTTAGKYFVYGNIIGFANTSNLNSNRAIIKKNGTIVKYAFSDFRNNPAKTNSVMATTVVDMNGSSDYIELFALVEYSSSATVQVLGASYNYSAFGAYKILT
jgi:hypothetical protein